ncbi:NifB/NifX family molybdenum-iron cluster-binding protein [Candidatus Thiothrix anitrata]|uniref:Nitrogen fixation protein n=1 Tax=Candidatus Thiothrix anitrata TaxID=2823902 RepID=A0ABX7X7M8_9GAMM|nr:nitrogen fixation protein [Candidatus Thiothrix anitrata]QTR51263.1 nitrogen fixation protein [Candidatus Thiothrix anitrata]
MKIGVTSQNLRTVTGHASKARSFLLYEWSAEQAVQPLDSLELSMEMSIHAWDKRGDHPLLALDYLITGPCGKSFINQMKQYGVRVKTTDETDPLLAVQQLVTTVVPWARKPA